MMFQAIDEIQVQCNIRERYRLLDRIEPLYIQYQRMRSGKIIPTSITSIGDRNVAVTSAGPAENLKMVWVGVICVLVIFACVMFPKDPNH